jgi:hypothetical protein
VFNSPDDLIDTRISTSAITNTFKLKMKWLPFSSTGDEPEYHLASEDDVRRALAQWKRRYYTLATLYTLTMLLGVAYVLMSKSLATGMIRSEAYFGNSVFSVEVASWSTSKIGEC